MRKHTKRGLWFWLVFYSVAAVLPVARAEIVYDNSAHYLNNIRSSTNEFGASVTLGGSPQNRYVTVFYTSYYLYPTNLVSGQETVRLKFYDTTGPGNAPGNALYDSGLLPAKGNVNGLTVNPNVSVPDNFIWTVQFGNLPAGVKGALFFYYPPVVGSSSTNFLEKIGGVWNLLYSPSTPGSFYAQITAIPPLVNIPPIITSTPQSQVAFEGTDVNLSAVATGSAPLQYQWTFYGTNLAGATNASLTLHNVTTNQAGLYNVVVTNPSSTVTSAPPAVLTVIRGQIVFDNTTNYLGLTTTSTNEFGDQITLGGNSSNRKVTLFKVEYDLGTINLTGNERLQLRFYENSGLNGSPGRLLYDGGTTPLLPGFNFATFFPNVVVPDTFTWSVKFTGVATNASVSLTLYDPPGIGSSGANYWENFAGTWAMNSIAGVRVNFGVQVVADLKPADVAPTIVTQPQSQIITNGNNVTLSVNATGSPPLNYQWNLNGANLAGANFALLALTNVAANQAGNYTVTITNAAGSITSQVAPLTVLVPPAITSQPQGVTEVLSNNVTFSVTATGSNPLNYQWYKNASPLAGATNASLLLTTVSTNEVGIYQVVVANAAGSAISSNAPLTLVYGRLVYDNTVNNRNMTVNSTNEFGDQITLGGNPMDRKLTQFQLEYSLGTNGTGHEKIELRFYDNTGTNNSPRKLLYDSGPVPAATGTKAITFNPFVEVPDSFAWTVQFSGVASNQQTGLTIYDPPAMGSSSANFWENVGGTNWVLGSLTNVSVNFSAFILAVAKSTNNPPIISAQPLSLTVTNGDSAVFSADASGSIPLNYQWRWYGTNLTSPNSPLLVLTNLTPAQAGPYTAQISNSAGSVTSQVANLTVLVPAAIQTQPQSLAVVIATNVTFNVTASGTTPFSYQWSKNGLALAGATNAVLTLPNVTTNDAGSYSVVVANAAGRVTSATATLTVALGWVVYSNLSTYLGFTVSTTNEFGDQITLGGDPLDRYVAQFEFEYDLPTNNVTGKEMVRLRFYDTAGVNNTPGNLLYDSGTMPLLPSFNTVTVYPYVAVPDTFIWTVQFSGLTASQKPSLSLYDPPVVGSSGATYWEKASTGWLPRTVPGYNANFGALVIANVKNTNIAPSIVTQPLSQTVTNGINVTLRVDATGSVPLSYQWWYNGASLAGATNFTLTFNNISTNKAGNYAVVVSNSGGSITSQVAVVTVLAPPTIQTQPQNLVGIIGTNLILNVAASGTTPFNYQWNLNGTPLPGATNDTLALLNVTTNNSGAYTVVIKNVAGVITSATANILVVPPPSVGLVYDNTTTYLNNLYSSPNEFGDEVQLAGSPLERRVMQFKFRYYLGPTVTGSETARLRFYDNTAPDTSPLNLLFDTGPVGIFVGTNDFITTPNVDVPGDFTWSVQFMGISGQTVGGVLLYNPPTIGASSNSFWEKINDTWNLRQFGAPGNLAAQILAGPDVIVPPFFVNAPANQTALEGSKVTFNILVGGTAPFTYQWLFNGQKLTNATTNGNLLLSQVTMNQAGAYQVVVTNYAGSITSVAAQLQITPLPPVITLQPANQTVVAGTNVTLSVAATGFGPLSYQWQFNSANLAGATNSSLSLTNIQTTNAGLYVVIVSNPGGSTTSQAALITLPGLPVISVQPFAQSVSAGENVTFAVVGQGANLRYQWRLNGQMLGGATNAMLVLTNVTGALTGLYTVEVANANGTSLSAPAALSLLNLNITTGNTARLTITGPTGSNFRLESLDAFDATHSWTRLANITLTNNPFLFLDTNSPSYPKRFYRALWQPN